MRSFHVIQYKLLKARFQRKRTQRKMKVMFLNQFECDWNQIETKGVIASLEDRIGLIASVTFPGGKIF